MLPLRKPTVLRNLLFCILLILTHKVESLSPTAAHGPSPTALVVVGAAGELIFSPKSIDAAVGSVIKFDFLALNHTLTQSRIENPCEKAGFSTGFHQFNPTNASGRFVVDFVVETDEPQWFYCAQTVKKSHCEAGMVFSLNPRGKAKEFENAARMGKGGNMPLAKAATARQCAAKVGSLATGTTAAWRIAPTGTTATWMATGTIATGTVATGTMAILSGRYVNTFESSSGRIGPSPTQITPVIDNGAYRRDQSFLMQLFIVLVATCMVVFM